MEQLRDILSILSTFILLSAFLLLTNHKISSQIRALRFQSLLITACAGTLGIYRLMAERQWDGMLIIFAFFLGIKVIYLPLILQKLTIHMEHKEDRDGFLSAPASLIIGGALVIMNWYFASHISIMSGVTQQIFTALSLSVMMIALLFIISHKSTPGIIIGLLMLGNGICTGTTLIPQKMPAIAALGIICDVPILILVSGVFILRSRSLTFSTAPFDLARKREKND